MRREFLLVVALLLGSCVHANTGESGGDVGADQLTDICDIFANPATYSGARIEVRGIVRTDYLEFSGITHADCPSRTIAFGPERHVRDGLSDFLGALERVRGDRAHVVEVTASGVLSWRPGQAPVLVLDVGDFSGATVVGLPPSIPPIDPR